MWSTIQGPPCEASLVNDFGSLEPESETDQIDQPTRKRRRSAPSLEENLHLMEPHIIGEKMLTILEDLDIQLKRIESPLGLRRENPVQSCLDIGDNAKSGRQDTYQW